MMIEESLLSPYQHFTRKAWSYLRADTPLTLNDDDLERLQAYNDPISLSEVVDIYLPLSRLISLYAQATQQLHFATQKFLGHENAKTPYIIGIAGSVAVGKSTTSRVLQALLSRWPNTPKVELITTDGFLLPNAVLEKKELLNRKGFPESYDLQKLLKFLQSVKAGDDNIKVPLYSHVLYDVLPHDFSIIERPDILIVEGLNVLQAGKPSRDAKAVPFVSDFFDFSIFIDADEDLLASWYVDRFMKLRATAFLDENSYFHRYASVSDSEAIRLANKLWATINLVNLRENIQPTRPRADLILRKDEHHDIEDVWLRKL